jgi:hypothetical protein
MNVYVLVTFKSYGENPEVEGVYTSETLAANKLEEFLNESLAHSGFIQETELVDIRGF